MDQETIDLVAFDESHLDGAVLLSREAGWPHRREDWAMLLTLGQGFVALQGDTVVGTSAHTNASLSTLLVPGVSLSWAASYPMLRGAMDAAAELTDAPVHAGPVYSSDLFYLGRAEIVQGLAALGTLGVEMEAAGLYAAAAQEATEALTVLTVSDHLFDSTHDMSAEERETLYANSVKVGAAALLA